MPSERIKGQVRWFNSKKGYGFIANGSGDVFVHHTAIRTEGYRKLDDGQRVEYTLQRTERGMSAADVVPID